MKKTFSFLIAFSILASFLSSAGITAFADGKENHTLISSYSNAEEIYGNSFCDEFLRLTANEE